MGYKDIKIIAIIATLLVLIVAVAGCTQTSTTNVATSTPTPVPAPTTQTITDMYGNTVVVPTKIDRIVDGWPAHNEVLAMLGVSHKIVGTNTVDQSLPWFAKIEPNITKIPAPVSGSTINIETVMQCDPDLVILSTGFNDSAEKLKQNGIPVVILTFLNFDDLKTCFRLTGTILGPQEEARAEQFITYFDSKLVMLNDTVSTIPEEEKPRVLHVMSLNPLKIDGNNTLINTWIRTAGGVNAAADDVSGNGQVVTIEQVLAWDPDVIIIGGKMSDLNTVNNDTQWKQLKAVQNEKVYINPKGVFSWDRYGAEEALQIQWAAKTLHPDRFSTIDMRNETRSFYKTFFNYDLTESDLDSILYPQA